MQKLLKTKLEKETGKTSSERPQTLSSSFPELLHLRANQIRVIPVIEVQKKLFYYSLLSKQGLKLTSRIFSRSGFTAI